MESESKALGNLPGRTYFEPNGTQYYKVSDIDSHQPDFFISFLLPYPVQSESQVQQAIQYLDRGLRHAIVQIPLMTGSLVVGPDDKLAVKVLPDSRLDLEVRRIPCEEHKSFSDLSLSSFSPDDLDETQLLPPVALQSSPSPLPVCFVRLNVMEEGLILAIGINHIVADISSMDTFMKLICQGGRAHSHGITMPAHQPNLDRTRYNGPHQPSSATVKHGLQDRVAQYSVVDSSEPARNFEKYEPRPSGGALYMTTEPEIQEIKKSCQSLEGVEYITSYDCVVAMLWRCITRARLTYHPQSHASPSRFVHPVDLRKRFPETNAGNYFGNAFMTTRTEPLEAGQLLEDNGVSVAASLIRRSILSVNMEGVADLAALISLLGRSEKLQFNMNELELDFLTTSWLAVDTAEYDFGLEAPIAYRTRSVPRPGVGILFPDCQKGPHAREYTVYVVLPLEEQEILRGDEEFLRYFKVL